MSTVPPKEYVCPLTKKLMVDPVVSRYGNHFERKAILKWLDDGNMFCPVTGNPLRPSSLISDKTLAWKIRYWAEKSGHGSYAKGCRDESEGDSADFFGMTSAVVNIPNQRYFCPITKEIMEDPVMSRHGDNFERKAILKWFDDMGAICPVSGNVLRPSDLVTNSKLQWEIRQWQLNYGDPGKEISRLGYEDKLSVAKGLSCGFNISDVLQALTVDTAGREAPIEHVDDCKVGKSNADAPNRPQVLAVLDEVVDALND